MLLPVLAALGPYAMPLNLAGINLFAFRVLILLMAAFSTPLTSASARLVQDFGRPSDAPVTFEIPAPAAPSVVTPEPPVKRGRGRPPGSRKQRPN